jgi:surface polysaccharide O-acyltransferase-like enzyme
MQNTSRSAMPDERISLTRVTACFMVVVLHTAGAGFYSFGRGWWAANFFDSLTRACVPLFLMISGALLIPRQEPYGEYVRKRVIRIVPPILFWSLVYALYWHLFNDGVVVILKKLLTAKIVDILWYLYLLVGLYLFLPFLARMYHSLDDRMKRTFIGLWIVCSSIPTIQNVLGMNTYLVGTYGLSPFVGLFGYMFTGAYIFERADHPGYMPKPLASILVFLIACAFTALATYWLSVNRGQPNELFYQYLAPGVTVSALASFSFFAGLRRFSILPRLTKPIAEGSLGIYCLHLLILINVLDWVKPLATRITPWLMVPLASAFVFLVATVVIYLFRRLPLARYVA